MSARKPRTCAALATIFLAAACARRLPGGLLCPAHGGPEWNEYRTRHLDLFSDLDRRNAAAMIERLETLHAMLVRSIAGEDRPIPGHLRVIVPADEATFDRIAPRHSIGYSTVDWLGQPTLVLDAAAFEEAPEIVAHEMVYHLSWHFFARQPLWFREGLAWFHQTVANPAESGAAGLVPRMGSEQLKRRSDVPQVPVRALLSDATDGREIEVTNFWSWVLYHWLRTERPQQLEEYQRSLAQAREPALAWARAFPEFDLRTPGAPEKLDRILDAYRRRGEYAFWKVEAHPDTSFETSAVSAAEVHMLLLTVRARWAERDTFYSLRKPSDRQQIIDSDTTEALSEDPAHPVAAFFAGGDAWPAVETMRKTTVAHPTDWRAWFLLARTLRREEETLEKEAALREAIRLNPDSARAHNELAWLLVTRGRAREALPFGKLAVELAPADGPIVDTLAAIEFALGVCGEALRLQLRAVALLPAPHEEMTKRLRQYVQRCGRF